MSRRTTATESKLSAIDGEACALLWALKELQSEVYSASQVMVLVDHEPLEFLVKNELANADISASLKQKILPIITIIPSVKYRPGHLNILANVLTRNPLN